MTKHNYRKIGIIFGLLFMLALVLAPKAVARAAEKGSVTIQYAPVKDTEFRIYKVGEMDGHDGYVLNDDFAKYNVNLFDDKAADTLAGYVYLDDIEPLAVNYTDENGIVTFTDLEIGAYLILGDAEMVEDGDVRYYYTPQPILLSIPTNVDGEPVYDVEVNNKFSEITETKGRYTVKKVWAADEEKNRPESIVVSILKDKKVVEEVTLNAENNWTYTWEVDEEDSMSVWEAVEKKVPEGYLVAVEQVDGTFVITNTATKPPTPPTPNPPTTPTERIPQTGFIWWPILMMIAGGLFLLIVGTLLVRKNH